jgi:hypothetical protein
MECYFHPDWTEDAASADDVLREFIGEAHADAIQELLTDISAVLAGDPSESDLVDLFENQMGNMYRVGGAAGWLAWLQTLGPRLEELRAARDTRSSNPRDPD